MNRERGKILVIRGGAIGDFILTLPAIEALRKQFPETRIEVLGYPHIACLALMGSRADAVRSIESRPLARFFARGIEQDPAWIEYFESCNIVLSYLYDPDGLFQSNVENHVRGQFIAGRHRPDESQSHHATQVFLEPLERLAIFDADPAPRLVTGVSKQKDGVVLALHPGSGGTHKIWPQASWMRLAARMARSTRWRFLIVGGEAEGGFLRQLASEFPEERVEVLQHSPLDSLAMRLAGCTAFIGHDSGISHLAAAVGLPVLALWGPTREEIWKPLGEQVSILKHDSGLEGLDDQIVLATLERIVARC